MTTINPYLNFNGNCKEAFDFYKSVFGGEFPYVGTFGEMPPSPEMPPMPEEMKSRIMHISLPISKETILMGSDTMEGFGPALQQGNNYSISINTATKEETERLYNGLSEGGEIKMPLNETFWGAYFGMFVDKFGIHWMVNCELEKK
jgi:PhnB protein